MNGLLTKPVNASSPQFQAQPSFPADKESLWTYPPSSDGWIWAHNALRAELQQMTLLIAHLGDRKLEAWEVHSMRAWWACHELHVHDHHQNEDEIMTPEMATRINLPAKLTTDHQGLISRMEALKVLFSNLTNAKELFLAWSEYQVSMLPHLFEEEQIALPLLRAFFTPAEAAALVGKILKVGKPAALGSFFYWMGSSDPNAAHTDFVTDLSIKAAATTFMAQEGIPWFVWHLEFKGYIQAYQDAMVNHAVALFCGEPPAMPASWFGCCQSAV
mmetsp:Transcript_16207/g.25903  ORF Transcript_16207/g.25903 Transcript_16207/m.25903 type:complete len:273 (-) Transcript_16207:74-892(-)